MMLWIYFFYFIFFCFSLLLPARKDQLSTHVAVAFGESLSSTELVSSCRFMAESLYNVSFCQNIINFQNSR